MQALCDICGMGWCSRPCLRDPKKSNALLFHPDGRAKTLHERGLGWDDPPLETKKPKTKAKLQVVSSLKGLLKESNRQSNGSNKAAPAAAESNKPKFDRAAYQRELMRKRRAADKPKKARP